MMTSKRKKLLISLPLICIFAVVAGLIVHDYYVRDFSNDESNTVAMGTAVSVRIYGSDNGIEQSLTSVVSSLEAVISPRIDGSAAELLNRTGSVTDSDISAMTHACNDVFRASAGAFDATVGAVSSLWNIGFDNARVPSQEELDSALNLVDGSALTVEGDTVSLAAGQTADFGAVGKGYACDKIYQSLLASDAKGAVVSVGGSVLLYGNHNRSGDDWRVAIRNPNGATDDYVGIIEMPSGFVSTSGDYERTLEYEGKTYCHILDPATGYPADSGLQSVTVKASSGALADALSTACFVLGTKKGIELLKVFSAEGVFIGMDNSVTLTEGLVSAFTLVCDDFYLK